MLSSTCTSVVNKYIYSRHIRSEVQVTMDIHSEVQHTIYFKAWQFTRPFYMECFHRSTVKSVIDFVYSSCIINQTVLCTKRRLRSDTISLVVQVSLTIKLEKKNIDVFSIFIWFNIMSVIFFWNNAISSRNFIANFIE